ncbi:MerR family transcriptional regulator [bacterium]|nr:MAG: MerR family transcriptional regulator [bacterium]
MLYDKQGKIVKVYPYGSEPQQRWENFFDILYEARKRSLKKKAEKKLQKEQLIDSQIAECDKTIFRRQIKWSDKRYNMTQTARILDVHRETLYYWIKKGWLKPKRDYRNYPVFTVLDIEKLIKWKNTIK